MNNQDLLSLAEFYSAEADALRIKYKQIEHLIGLSHHSPSEGTYCEALLKEFLRRTLPRHVSVDSGFVRRVTDADMSPGAKSPLPADADTVPCLMLRKTGQVPPVAVVGMTPNQVGVPPSNQHTILIVDDVYATGATAARVVDFLRGFALPADVDFHIAAPLLIPAAIQNAGAVPDINEDDLPQDDEGDN